MSVVIENNFKCFIVEDYGFDRLIATKNKTDIDINTGNCESIFIEPYEMRELANWLLARADEMEGKK